MEADEKAGEGTLYDAFLSYSHSADSELAPVLQRHLQRFAKPWYRLRSLRVFRDETTLASTPQLWPDIREALAASRFFILFAAPEAAQSHWVAQEVSHWITHKGPDTLLIVLTEGRIEWDDDTGDFDWTVTNALPQVLKGVFRNEPKWEDLSLITSGNELTMQNPVLRKAVASLFSAITGRPLDEVIGEDVRQHRSTRIVASSAIGAILIVGIGLVLSLQQTRAARLIALQNKVAEVETRSRYVAERALEMVSDGDAGTAMNRIIEDLDSRDANRFLERPLSESHYALQAGLLNNYEKAIMRVGGEVRTLDVSRDQRLIAIGVRVFLSGGAFAHHVDVFEAGSYRRLVRLPHDGMIMSTVFSRDGAHLLTAGRDHKVTLWDWANKAIIRQFAHDDDVMKAVFNADDTLIASGANDRVLAVWDAATGERLQAMMHGTPEDRSADVNDLTWSRDGSRIFTVSHDGSMTIWDWREGRKVFEARAPWEARLPQRWLSVSPDNQRVLTIPSRASPGYNGPAMLWDWEEGSPTKGQVIAQLDHQGNLFLSGTFSPDGSMIATTDTAGRVSVWDGRTGEKFYEIIDHAQGADGATFSADGSRLLTWSPDRTARVYAACDGRPIAVLGGHREDIGVARFTGDQCTVLTGAGDATVRVWKLLDPTGQVLLGPQTCPPAVGRTNQGRCKRAGEDVHARRALQNGIFSPDGRWAATASFDGIARVYDARSGALVREIGAPQEIISAVAFSDDGKLLFTGQGRLGETGRLQAWDWQTGTRVRSIETPSYIRTIKFSPDRSRILIAGGNGIAMILDAGTGATIAKLHHNRGRRTRAAPLSDASWSPDGSRVVTASFDYHACVWQTQGLSGGVTVDEPLGCVRHGHRIYTAIFTRDGSRIVTASGDKSVVVWNARTVPPQASRRGVEGEDTQFGDREATFRGKNYDFRTARLVAGDNLLLTTNSDNAVRLWDMKTKNELAVLRYREELINGLDVTADETRLLTTSVDGTARVWQLYPYVNHNTDDLVARAKQVLPRCLSRAEREEYGIEREGPPAWCTGKLSGPEATENGESAAAGTVVSR